MLMSADVKNNKANLVAAGNDIVELNEKFRRKLKLTIKVF